MSAESGTPWAAAFRTMGPLNQSQFRDDLRVMWQRLMGEHGADQGPTENRAARELLYQLGSTINLASSLSFILDDLRRQQDPTPYAGSVYAPGDDDE